VIASRYYTPNDIGIVSAILSSIFLISMISSIGLPMALTFYLPIYSKNANRIINTCLIIGIIISAIFSTIYILGVNIWAPELKPILSGLTSITIFIMTTIMTTISLLMNGMFTAGKKSSFNMIKENIFGFTKIFPLTLLVGSGAIGIFVSWGIGMIIAMITGFYLLFKSWKYKPMFILDPTVKDMTTFSIGNYIAGIFYMLPKLIFPILIIDIISSESAGYFFIAMTIASLLYGIPEAVAGPFLAESSDKNKFWNNVNKVIKFNIYLLVPGLLLFMIFGKFVLNIFNPNYAENSFMTLIILSMASLPLSLVVIFNIIRSSQKRIMSIIKTNGTVAVMTIILSIPLMRIWNIEGIAISYFIANTMVATIIIFRMKNPIESTLRLIKGDQNVISI